MPSASRNVAANMSNTKHKESDESVTVITEDCHPTPSHVDGHRTDTQKRIEENEQFIVDLLARSQPYHDHCYTTVFGKRKAIDHVHLELDSDDDGAEEYSARTTGVRSKFQYGDSSREPEGHSKTVTLKVNAGMVPTVNNVHIPIIRLARIPVAPDGTPLVSAEEVVIQDADEDKKTSTSAASK